MKFQRFRGLDPASGCHVLRVKHHENKIYKTLYIVVFIPVQPVPSDKDGTDRNDQCKANRNQRAASPQWTENPEPSDVDHTTELESNAQQCQVFHEISSVLFYVVFSIVFSFFLTN